MSFIVNKHQLSAEMPFQTSLDKARQQRSAGRYGEAIRTLLPEVQKNPENPALLHEVADTYSAMGKENRSILVLTAITKTWPEDTDGWRKLGVRSLAVGERDTAKFAFEAMLRLGARAALPLCALNLMDTFTPTSPEANQLRDLADSADLDQAETTSVLNALGQIERKAGNTASAMALFQRSKDAVPGSYTPENVDQKIAEQIQVFSAADWPEVTAAQVGPCIAFIVGLPRSGTTLLEAMLCRHPDIASIGESPVLSQTCQTLRRMVQSQSGDTGSWSWLKQAPAPLLETGGDSYLQNAVPDQLRGSPVLIDKMPGNVTDIGFARMILPSARFVFMMRHPLDVGLSLLSNDFAGNLSYTKRQDWIAHMIRTVYASVEHYRDTIGDGLRLQSYRALVEHPEQQLRGVLQHLNLDWDPSCLDHTQSQSSHKTASVLQVRRGLNRSGLGKWKTFEAELQPLIRGLGGWDWINHWEDLDAAAQS